MSQPMRSFLETDRLRLRPFTEADAANLLALDNDPDVLRYIGIAPLADLAAYRELIRNRMLPYHAAYTDLGFWVAEERATDTFVGWFHLRPAPDYKFATEAGYLADDLDIGYRLRRPFWNRGYATEISHALLRFAFHQRQTPRVVATALVGNTASCRVLEKVGLERLREYALPGYDMPAAFYAVTREEYLRKYNTPERDQARA